MIIVLLSLIITTTFIQLTAIMVDIDKNQDDRFAEEPHILLLDLNSPKKVTVTCIRIVQSWRNIFNQDRQWYIVN